MGEAMEDYLNYRPPTPLHAQRDAAGELVYTLKRMAAGLPIISSNDPEFWARHDALACGFADIPSLEEAVARYAELQSAVEAQVGDR